MAVSYKPLSVKGNATGLVQNREDFILPDDAYPVLENAYVWRERIKRKQGWHLLGRLSRTFTNVNFLVSPNINVGVIFLTVSGYVSTANNANPGKVTTLYPHNLMTGDAVIFTGISGATGYNGTEFFITVTDPTSFTIGADATGFGVYTSGGSFISNRTLTLFEPNATIEPGSFTLNILTGGPGIVFTDNGQGVLSSTTPGNAGTINYQTATFILTATTAAPGTSTTISYTYFPGLPVMGARSQEITATNSEQTVFFDTVYAYKYVGSLASGGFIEYLPGTVWTGTDFEFFWSTNYWVDFTGILKIFWVTNNLDPIRYTNGSTGTWVNFQPIINASNGILVTCLCLLPFRGRLVAFNTTETDGVHTNRIRWAEIGNPFTVISNVVTDVVPTAWRDDIRGKGGFLDIPTTEDIITVGFVRDNLVIYCENSTWQLRYTGRSIAPFQIEKVNTELGAMSTFSAIQFDTSLVGIGDKGVVECDSFKAERIDIKIPDLVMSQIHNANEGQRRIQGVRNFETRLAYWIYPNEATSVTYPDRRLVYNYENDSWAIFTDCLTALGTFQPQTGRTWAECDMTWAEANFSWIERPAIFPEIVGGNQQGFVLMLDQLASNQESLYISAISSDNASPTVITVPNHNLVGYANQEGAASQVIQITSIAGTGYSSLNGKLFGISVVNDSQLMLFTYNAEEDAFTDDQLDPSQTYIGGGMIKVRDNFTIQSKKFNYLDEGQKYQLGYLDVLFASTPNGAVTLNVYTDYNTGTPSNTIPLNASGDTFFNSIVETSNANGIDGGNKQWKRIFCATQANFVTLEWTLSNLQMIGVEQLNDVQIDASTIWSRPAGRMGLVN